MADDAEDNRERQLDELLAVACIYPEEFRADDARVADFVADGGGELGADVPVAFELVIELEPEVCIQTDRHTHTSEHRNTRALHPAIFIHLGFRAFEF